MLVNKIRSQEKKQFWAGNSYCLATSHLKCLLYVFVKLSNRHIFMNLEFWGEVRAINRLESARHTFIGCLLWASHYLSKQLMNIFLVILSTSIWGWHCYYLHFKDKETENFSKVTHLMEEKPEEKPRLIATNYALLPVYNSI